MLVMFIHLSFPLKQRSRPLEGVPDNPFTGITYQISRISDIYITIHNGSIITAIK